MTGPTGPQGPPGRSGSSIYAGALDLPVVSANLTGTACSSNGRSESGDGSYADLEPGVYRPVFVGQATIGVEARGFSRVLVQVRDSANGMLAEFAREVSANAASDSSFGYFVVGGPMQVHTWTSASTTCGTAAVIGSVGFEQVVSF